MRQIKLVSLDYTETQTVINFNSYDDSSDQSQPSIGAWTVPGNITKEEAVAYAKTMINSDDTVSSIIS